MKILRAFFKLFLFIFPKEKQAQKKHFIY